MRGKEKRKKRKSDTLREQREMYEGGEVALLAYWEYERGGITSFSLLMYSMVCVRERERDLCLWNGMTNVPDMKDQSTHKPFGSHFTCTHTRQQHTHFHNSGFRGINTLTNTPKLVLLYL